MRPLLLTITGAAVGLTAVLPLARAQVDATTPAVIIESAPGPTAAGGTATGALQVTATGPVVGTRYGPVQVKVTVTGSRVVAATAVQLPDGDGQSRQISSYAGPRLDQAAVATQGAGVDTVSGASYTSDGYRRSLQAALDTARAVSAQQGQGRP
jgi:uncharacterized protein with FMN-binding domain